MELQNHFEKLSSYIPVPLLAWPYLLYAFLFLFLVILFRYFLFVAIFWIPFYAGSAERFSSRRIYRTNPPFSQQRKEIYWSFVNAAIFAGAGLGIGILWQSGHTQIYLGFKDYGLWYLPISLFLASLLHEVYFYSTHRMMHRPRIFRWFHRVHHESREPSPWASFSFHPLEGIVQAAALPLIVLILPMHPTMILIYLTLMTLSAIVNHLGFETLPSNSAGEFIGHHLVSGLHHARHHHSYKYNYCLFYPAIDRIFRTEEPGFSAALKDKLKKSPRR